jgi:Flp pilus assembly protein TadD
MNRASKTFAVLIFSLLGCFAVFLAIEFFLAPERAVIPAFLSKWHSLRALDATIRMALPLTCISTLLVFGLFKIKADEHVVYSRFMQRMTVDIVALCALYAFFILLGSPLITQEIHRLERVSEAFKDELAQTETALSAGDFASAKSHLKVAALINQKDPRYVSAKGAYLTKSTQASEEKKKQDATAPAVGEKQQGELTAADLYTQAQQAFDSGDYYQAHSLASEASRIDKSRHDAQRLAAQAWDRLSKMNGDIADETRRKIAEDKRLAYTALRNGDPIKAYESFYELSKKAPQDKDINRYLKESLAALKLISFSVDEVTRLSLFPQAKNVLLRLSSNNEGITYLAAKRAYIGNEVIYLTNMEYLVATEGGEVITHITAPYAKIKNGRILLTGYDKDMANKAYSATVITGAVNLDANYLELPIKTGKLALAIRANESIVDLPISDIFSAIRDTEAFGVQVRNLRLEALKRMCLSFNFLFFSLLSLYFGYRFKYQGKKSPLIRSILLTVPSFILISTALKGWNWLQTRVAFQLDNGLGSFASTLIAYGAIQLLATVAAFILLAGYREKPSD